MNTIVQLHNSASMDETYGEKLLKFTRKLADQNKVPDTFPEQIYILSVDWPLDLACSMFTDLELGELHA